MLVHEGNARVTIVAMLAQNGQDSCCICICIYTRMCVQRRSLAQGFVLGIGLNRLGFGLGIDSTRLGFVLGIGLNRFEPYMGGPYPV